VPRLRLRRLRWVVLALVAAWLVATGFLFVWPSEDTPKHADAVIVLSGSRTGRLDKGLTLMRGRVAPVLVVSNGLDPRWPEANRVCADKSLPFEVICFHPTPFSTRGEAEAIARIGAKRGWRSIVIVSSTYHVTRARMLFERCFKGRVEAVGARYALRRLPLEVLYEWGKLAYALTLKRGC
jgi:uncharacterized SAM-binding protein YcdF (DUF218 family)